MWRRAFLPPGRPKAETPPLGGQQAGEARAAWGVFLAAGPPQGRNAPLGGQQAGEARAAWGHVLR